MRLPRIFVDLPLRAGARLTLPPASSEHLVRVLRLRSGDPLVLFNGDGRDYAGRLQTPGRNGALVEVGSAGDVEPSPLLSVHLGIGVSKGERMDFALQKAVELGVARITPLFTERSVVRLAGERLDRRQRHWYRVVVGACEQSGRRRLAELETAVTLDGWLSSNHPYPILLDHRSPTPLPSLPAPAGELTLLVGPEGGLAKREKAWARQSGFAGVRLGPRILRTETAPLAALAAIQTLWGDFLG
ncbi:MAG: 16S rRNA (uracil(1498)-N(3))-methyltransferase [Pseudomonadota bacterium]|nr:16S rRNA (uracil(1498)-N(3))-methyltransferase [Pseudomonadota bacterium]